MTDIKTMDLAATVAELRAPSPHFRLFTVTEEKAKAWADHLISDQRYIEDDARNMKNVSAYISWLLFGDCMNITYEIVGDAGEMVGVLSFSTIIPGHKAKVDWYMWDGGGIWGASFARETRALVNLIMRLFNLHRVWSNTANPRIVKFVKGMGGKVEGVKVNDFKHDGKLYDNYMLAYTRQSKED